MGTAKNRGIPPIASGPRVLYYSGSNGGPEKDFSFFRNIFESFAPQIPENISEPQTQPQKL
ncbi:MAG: hypothetical protein DMG96_28120 [Acidobacteria bacterium]|nr:MAG: hypothetical protein DMG96_28120 [Acidobacteriota bacterium]